MGWTFNAGTWVFGEDSGDQGYWNDGSALGEMTYVFQSYGELTLGLKNNHGRDTVEATLDDATILSLAAGVTETKKINSQPGHVLKLIEKDDAIILITEWSFVQHGNHESFKP